MVIAVFIVRLLNEKELFDNMHYVFLLFPTYAYVFISSIHSEGYLEPSRTSATERFAKIVNPQKAPS